MNLTDSNAHSVIIDEKSPLGKGGEGIVFKTLDKFHDGLCVKLFDKEKFKDVYSKIGYLISHQPSDEFLLEHVSWPIDFVKDNTEYVGYLMRIVPNDYDSIYKLTIHKKDCLLSPLDKSSMIKRYEVLLSLTCLLQTIENLGLLLADLKPQNLFFNSRQEVFIVDIDSIQITSHYPAGAISEEYAYPPELNRLRQGIFLSSDWHSYSFAIIAYQILHGIHPYVCSVDDVKYKNVTTCSQKMSMNLFVHGSNEKQIMRKPELHSYFYYLSESLQNIFLLTLDLTCKTPSIGMWKDVLSDCLNHNGDKNEIEANCFSILPHKPLFRVISQSQDDGNATSVVRFRYVASYTDKLFVNNKEIPREGTVTLPLSLSFEFVAKNYYGEYRHIVNVTPISLFCINCGTKFYDKSDKFCIHCGVKRF